MTPQQRTGLLCWCLAVGASVVARLGAAELRVPAYTAYVEPDPRGARVAEATGVTGWTDPAQRVVWCGEFRQAGELRVALALRLPAGVSPQLRLTLAGETHAATLRDDAPAGGAGRVDFGTWRLPAAGYQRLVLESHHAPGAPAGDLTALLLEGPATAGAHFNVRPRRNAASVHLRYPEAREQAVAAFYCEVTGIEDPVHTYYMACGWHRGYFGMQVNSPTERRIIFSVWDSGGEAVDRKKVATEDRVTLVAKGEGVFTGDFGHEGTGGHSHLAYAWRTGEVQRFLVTAQPTDATHTDYAGYWFRPDTRQWRLISAWRAPREGGWMRSLYSFSENFVGANGQLRREARYGNQWIRTAAGEWRELTRAAFSHDATGKADRLDRGMGLVEGQFFLRHGGYEPCFTAAGTEFTRPATGRPPEMDLTALRRGLRP